MKINAKTEALKKISRKLDFIAVIGSDVYSNELNADFDLPFFFSISFFLSFFASFCQPARLVVRDH